MNLERLCEQCSMTKTRTHAVYMMELGEQTRPICERHARHRAKQYRRLGQEYRLVRVADWDFEQSEGP